MMNYSERKGKVKEETEEDSLSGSSRKSYGAGKSNRIRREIFEQIRIAHKDQGARLDEDRIVANLLSHSSAKQIPLPFLNLSGRDFFWQANQQAANLLD
jgi:hypothetical protein